MCVCSYDQNAKLMLEAIGTRCSAGLEKLENKALSEKRLKKLEKYMVFDSERLEKLEMLLSLSLAWLFYPLQTDTLLHLTGRDFAIFESNQLSGSAWVNLKAHSPFLLCFMFCCIIYIDYDLLFFIIFLRACILNIFYCITCICFLMSWDVIGQFFKTHQGSNYLTDFSSVDRVLCGFSIEGWKTIYILWQKSWKSTSFLMKIGWIFSVHTAEHPEGVAAVTKI